MQRRVSIFIIIVIFLDKKYNIRIKTEKKKKL